MFRYTFKSGNMEKGLQQFATASTIAQTKAMKAAGMAVKRDALMVEPTTPIRTGFLRGSLSVMVDGERVDTNESDIGNPVTSDPRLKNPPNQIKAVVGANTPYALKVHTVPMNFRQKGAGNYYISRKLETRKDLYMKIAATALIANLKERQR